MHEVQGFRTERGRGTLLVARPALMAAALDMGLLERRGLERVLARAPAGASGRGATAILTWPDAGPSLVFRRLLHGGWLADVLGDRFLSPRRPLRELTVTAHLRQRGVAVPEPALVVGERHLGFWRLAVATLLEEDAVDAQRWLEAGPTEAEMLGAGAALGRAVRRFHDAGGHHADLHIKNLMIRTTGGGTEALVIDLDGARIVLGMTPEERMSQLMRLFRSLVKRGLVETVGARGCARFLRAYCADDRALRRAMWRRIDVELRRIAIHKLGYRRR